MRRRQAKKIVKASPWLQYMLENGCNRIEYANPKIQRRHSLKTQESAFRLISGKPVQLRYAFPDWFKVLVSNPVNEYLMETQPLEWSPD